MRADTANRRKKGSRSCPTSVTLEKTSAIQVKGLPSTLDVDHNASGRGSGGLIIMAIRMKPAAMIQYVGSKRSARFA